jgi:hypothetical protein
MGRGITETQRTTGVHIEIEWELGWILLRRRNDPGINRVAEPWQADRVYSRRTVHKRVKLAGRIMVVGRRRQFFILGKRNMRHATGTLKQSVIYLADVLLDIIPRPPRIFAESRIAVPLLGASSGISHVVCKRIRLFSSLLNLRSTH